MKYDMSGAAIVGSALHSLVKNEIKTNVVAVMPLVLNLVSANAQRPDDIITSYSGKTVEMDNTDAEGRLILADALTYAAKDLNATHLFDVATLTGAMIYSLGETYTGV
jgi:leucyl aminopeptidase